MLVTRENRKLDHIKLALSSQKDERSDFDDLYFVHRSLPESSWDNTCIATEIGGLKLSSPIFINAMTGGELSTKQINRGLAVAARETGVAMAVGSQRGALDSRDLAETFRVVRDVNPDGIVIANLGAGATPAEARQAIEMIEANLLQLHLNVPQELIMPEGDRHFIGILDSIRRVVEDSPVPVIVKEVGFGMARETYEQLTSAGVEIVDVGGRGGTNFINIENQRRTAGEYSYLLNWGQTTAVSLLEGRQFRAANQDKLAFLASGGIRDALDIAKCMALGASAVGVAGSVLKAFSDTGEIGVINLIQLWHEGIRTVLTMLGISHVTDLQQASLVITGKTKQWCEARNIPCS
jgi:isopentenyl-diphosphate delta-isomerase